MYIERVPNRNSPPAIVLRESYREQGKLKKRTLANLSSWPPEMVEKFQALLRGEVVANSQLDEALEIARSPQARYKAAHKLTSDGLPVHSFQSLLADLATVVKNTVQPKPLSTASFDKITQLTPVQQQAFNLLGLQL